MLIPQLPNNLHIPFQAYMYILCSALIIYIIYMVFQVVKAVKEKV
jgi:hypothetical protein